MAGTYSQLLYHIIFSTKQRMPLISESWESELHRYLGGIAKGEGGVPNEINGVSDHVHLLIKLKPTLAVSDFLRKLKTNSSKWINETHALNHKFHWQDGFAAFSVSTSRSEIVAKYIRNQKTHHQKKTFKDEFLTLLKKHNVDYDDRYIWD